MSKKGTYYSLPEIGSDLILTIQDHDITKPETRISPALLHARVCRVLGIEVDRLEQLKRAPAVVHEDVSVQVSIVVAIHNEAADLGEAIDHARVGVKGATSLHVGKIGTTGCLQSLTVEEKLAGNSVVGVELCQWSNGSVAHGAIVAGNLSGKDSISQFLYLLLHSGDAFLECFLKRRVLEHDLAVGMLLQFLLVLNFHVSELIDIGCNKGKGKNLHQRT